ncbi:MAG: hypothetical protein LAP87_30470 [Acidobacteriia bacterium]|nr:hypothetical protein [Terriglobia bacterium]
MNEVIETRNSLPQEAGAAVDLGRWLGRREAFGLMAGRCSAAEVESLRRIREQKAYQQVARNWSEFCTRHLKIHRRTVDRAIGYLQEFGPAFFHITQLTHISAKDYRAIARHVCEEGVNADGNVVALLPENSEKLSAAITGLLQRIAPKENAARPVSFDAAVKRCQAIGEMLEAMPAPLDLRQKAELASAVCDIRRAAASLGVVISGW